MKSSGRVVAAFAACFAAGALVGFNLRLPPAVFVTGIDPYETNRGNTILVRYAVGGLAQGEYFSTQDQVERFLEYLESVGDVVGRP